MPGVVLYYNNCVCSHYVAVKAAVSVSKGVNITFGCMETFIGPLSVSSCQTTVTCGTNSTYYLTTSVGSTNSTFVPDFTTCTASTVLPFNNGQYNIFQFNTLMQWTEYCDRGGMLNSTFTYKINLSLKSVMHTSIEAPG